MRYTLPPVPPALDTPEFRVAWQDFQTHRREIRHILTPLSAGRMLKMMAEWGVHKAVQSIENSIRNGWRGLFEPKENSSPFARTQRWLASRSNVG